MSIAAGQAEIVAVLDDMAENLAQVRALVTGGVEPPPTPTVTPTGQSSSKEIDWTLRGLKFLKVFYDAPGRSLHKSAASQAAKSAGYDPRGTAGFYVGNGSLVKVGDYRVLTDVGADWYEKNASQYPDELGDE